MNIFHIGLHKTGTTFLQKNVFNNANVNYINHDYKIYKSVVKELIYRDNLYFNKNNIASYFLSKNNLVSCEQLAGRSTGQSNNFKNIIDNIYEFDANAKIIFFIRRQDKFAESNYIQSVKDGSNLSAKETYKYIFNEYLDFRYTQIIYIDLFRYYNYINYLFEKFGKDNVLVIPYEEFKEDNYKVINKINNFTKLNFKIYKNTKRNRRLGYLQFHFLKIINIFFKSYFNPYGFRIKYNWSSFFNVINDFKLIKKLYIPIPSNKVYTTILNLCKKDNKRLDEKYKLNLKKYGYY